MDLMGNPFFVHRWRGYWLRPKMSEEPQIVNQGDLRVANPRKGTILSASHTTKSKRRINDFIRSAPSTLQMQPGCSGG